MDRTSFVWLRDCLRPLLKRTPTPMKPKPLSVGGQLWAALRFLTSCASLLVVAEAVHYGTTTVHHCVNDVCAALVAVLRHECFGWPQDTERLMQLVSGRVPRMGAAVGVTCTPQLWHKERLRPLQQGASAHSPCMSALAHGATNPLP
jgi:hypothetical protein